MATRRPKVPRATPAAPESPAAGLGVGDGGDVIQADFGGFRGAGVGSGTAAAAGKPATDAPASARPAPGKPVPGKPAAARPASGKPAAGAPGAGKDPARPGAGQSSPKRKSAGKPAADEPGESLDPVPAKAFSGRMLALGVVMIAITIMLAPTVKIFLDKRAEIAGLQADIAAQQAKQTDLKRQVSRWQDPNYVKQQARDRINMVMPGETGYWVFGSDLAAGQSGGAAGEGTAQDPADLPWVDALWQSIRRSATD